MSDGRSRSHGADGVYIQVFCDEPLTSSRSTTLADIAVSVVSIGAPRGPVRQSLLLLALLAVCTAVLASTAGTCPQLPLARVVVFIPPVFRLGQCFLEQTFYHRFSQ